MSSRKTDRVLKSIYYNPARAGSYGGVERLQKAVKEQTGVRVSTDRVQDWLAAQDAYTLHKTARKTYARNRVFAPRPLYQFQADLCDMRALSKDNDRFKFLLTVIDVFSKKAYARALKNKSAAEVATAFASVLDESGIPIKIQTDAGKEFFNHIFKKLMKKHSIQHFATGSDLKASVVERFNRTLKTKMWRFFTARNTHRYIDVIKDLLDSYNNSYHSSIKMKPIDVNSDKTTEVFENLYGTLSLTSKPHVFKFKEGDVVRISKYRGVFDKMYEQSFTDEYFIVNECIPRVPPVYKLRDISGEILNGTFYEPEMQKVRITPDAVFRIEKILDKKIKNGQKMVLVHWQGWPHQFDSWMPAKEVIELEKNKNRKDRKIE